MISPRTRHAPATRAREACLTHWPQISDPLEMANPDRSPLNISRLTQFVGVKEVCAALGISRSTLDRMRRDGGFPTAEQISPNRVGWRLDVIESFRHAQFRQTSPRTR